MSQGPLAAYRAMLRSGALAPDPSQAFVAEELALLENRLNRLPQRSGLLSWLRPDAPAPLGAYLFGGVGSGKTMLMDLFFASCRFEPKRRVHFQAFMSEAHGLIGKARKEHEGDPIPIVAESMLEQAQLLCVDELEVRDIADAMILARLFERLFKSGLILVATSNTAPRALYPDGINRPLFEPFIRLVEKHCDVIELDAARDYRRGRLGDAERYFVPGDGAATSALDALFAKLTAPSEAASQTLEVSGRRLVVPCAAMGVARFSFAHLCDRPLGPEDYRAIARAFHTVIVENIPVLTPEKRNAARRFITLIDALYDQGTGLIASAAAEPDQLYPPGDGAKEFSRTASRLMEMREGDIRSRRYKPKANATDGGLAERQRFGQTSGKV